MATSEHRKGEIRRKNLKEKLDQIATHRAKLRREENKKSYVIHTPKAELKRLGERSRSRT